MSRMAAPRCSARVAVDLAEHGAPVHAAVDEDGDRAVVSSDHDDGLGAHASGDEVASARDLARVPDEDPATMEDALHLVRDDRRIGVERGVDPIVLDEGFVVGTVPGGAIGGISRGVCPDRP
jgi:hypothetical protein